MGNLCGKQSKDGFDGPGRTLGSAPAPATKASVPPSANAGSTQKRTVGGPPRTLGERNSEGDAGLRAAAAAEARANKPSTGPLQKQLNAEKKQTREQLLKTEAKKNLRARTADQQQEVLQHN